MGDFTKRTPPLDLASLRENYKRDTLDERNCRTNPIEQFTRWMTEAKAADLKEPNAMTLSTVAPDGRPSGRIVLLKELDEFGFVFYTNYKSRKSAELKTNPFASLTFLWTELERQVRVEGSVDLVSREQSEKYFGGRPRGSQLGAWVSEQSKIVNNRQAIESRLTEIEARFEGKDVPTPEFWGGFRVVPDAVEFWQGRPNRLHDRILYRRKSEGEWGIERLWP